MVRRFNSPFFAFLILISHSRYVYPFNIPKITNTEVVQRRNFLRETVFATSAAVLISSRSASAKEVAPPKTRESVQAAFDSLKYELSGKDGSIAQMEEKIDAQDWVGLMEITKGYDQELRKGKVGKAKLYLPPEEKNNLTTLSNAITFDLIGINRNARPGQQNSSEAKRYLDELRKDLQTIIDKQNLVQYSE